jgi:hypothetical protein
MVNEPNKSSKFCFIAMPISDPPGYDSGHFRRVYEHLIRPACMKARVTPLRADDVKAANYIVLDILQRIINADLVVCDLSGRNPNVMYEVGVRQAFNLPIVFIKDQRTERVFDIQGFRTVDYDESLRIDCVNSDIETLRAAIEATMQPDHNDVNSLVKLLGISKAELPKNKEVSADTALILSSIRDISERLAGIEQIQYNKLISTTESNNIDNRKISSFLLPGGDSVSYGNGIYDKSGGTWLGDFNSIDYRGVIIKDKNGKVFIIPPEDPSYKTLSAVPF